MNGIWEFGRVKILTQIPREGSLDCEPRNICRLDVHVAITTTQSEELAVLCAKSIAERRQRMLEEALNKMHVRVRSTHRPEIHPHLFFMHR